jgi:hypothetical protein
MHAQVRGDSRLRDLRCRRGLVLEGRAPVRLDPDGLADYTRPGGPLHHLGGDLSYRAATMGSCHRPRERHSGRRVSGGDGSVL